MSTNGQRNGGHPRIEITSPVASPGEAAAVIAAIEQFLADTAPSDAPAPQVNPWQRAALLEGHRAKQAIVDAWGNDTRWGL